MHAEQHHGERHNLIARLQNLAKAKSIRVSFVGGDVHCAAIGRLYTSPKVHRLRHDHRFMPQVPRLPVHISVANAPQLPAQHGTFALHAATSNSRTVTCSSVCTCPYFLNHAVLLPVHSLVNYMQRLLEGLLPPRLADHLPILHSCSCHHAASCLYSTIRHCQA